MRQNGTVKFFNASKGCGFITPDHGGKDIFVHVTAVERSGLPALTEGQRISFETEQDQQARDQRRSSCNRQPDQLSPGDGPHFSRRRANYPAARCLSTRRYSCQMSAITTASKTVSSTSPTEKANERR
jgi:CspA family cold shock protein